MIWHEFGKPASRDGSIELCVYVLLTLTGTYSYKVLILFVCLIYFFFSWHFFSWHFYVSERNNEQCIFRLYFYSWILITYFVIVLRWFNLKESYFKIWRPCFLFVHLKKVHLQIARSFEKTLIMLSSPIHVIIFNLNNLLLQILKRDYWFILCDSNCNRKFKVLQTRSSASAPFSKLGKSNVFIF